MLKYTIVLSTTTPALSRRRVIMSKFRTYALRIIGTIGVLAIIVAAMLSQGTFGHLEALSNDDLKMITQSIAGDRNMSGTSIGSSETL